MYLEKELKEIIQIPSISTDIVELNKCLDYCVNFTLKDENSNKIFINKKEFNNTPSVLISNFDTLDFDILSVGHIDVVPANKNLFIPKLIDTKLYGRGSADMKCGVLLSLDILKEIIKLNKQIKYGVLIVGDEEIGGENGAKQWAKLGLNGKVLFDYDSGDGFNYISQKFKGILGIELNTTGIESHGSMPWDGLDANDIMFEIINELRKTFKSYSIKNKPEDLWTSTMHIGKIKGGDAINKISSNCSAVLDFRLTEKYEEKDILNILDNIIKTFYPNNVSYKILVSGKTVFSDMNNKYFQKYLEIYKKETGKDALITTFNGTTDIRYFVNKNNVVIHHNPDIGLIHSNEEFVELNSLKKLKEIGLKFILEYQSI